MGALDQHGESMGYQRRRDASHAFAVMVQSSLILRGIGKSMPPSASVGYRFWLFVGVAGMWESCLPRTSLADAKQTAAILDGSRRLSANPTLRVYQPGAPMLFK